MKNLLLLCEYVINKKVTVCMSGIYSYQLNLLYFGCIGKWIKGLTGCVKQAHNKSNSDMYLINSLSYRTVFWVIESLARRIGHRSYRDETSDLIL